MKSCYIFAGAVLLLIAGCGKPETTAPTGAPTNNTTEVVAQHHVTTFLPAGVLGASVFARSTNDGIYVGYKYVDFNTLSHVGKVQKFFANEQLKANSSADIAVYGMYPVTEYFEAHQEFGLYWVEHKQSGAQKYHIHNLNNGRPSMSEDVPAGFFEFEMVIPNKYTGTLWAISNESDDKFAIRENDLKSFTRIGAVPKDVSTSNYNRINFVVNKDGTYLYWPGVTKLYRYDHQGLSHTYDLSQFGSGSIQGMSEFNNKLYVSYGKSVYEIDGTSTRKLFDYEQAGQGENIVPSQPIVSNGLYVYTYEGKMYSVAGGAPVSYLGDRSKMSTADQATYDLLKGKLLYGGLYRTWTNANKMFIYVISGSNLYEILPK